MAGVKHRSGGARPGAGRPQTTYKINAATAKRLNALADHYRNDAGNIIEALINQQYIETLAPATPQLPDDAELLLHILSPEPQTIATLCKRMRMAKTELAQLITAHRDELHQRGVQLHVATHSDVKHAIKLPINSTEHTYYSKLSRNLFYLPPV